ncbi:MAG: hypothetical protein IJ147_02530 [Lachnospiraceae bacterium]|nr:hypothetical protein [Lachnospiraceae bacterium]
MDKNGKRNGKYAVRRIVIWAMMLVLVLSVTGCGESKKTPNRWKPSQSVTQQAETESATIPAGQGGNSQTGQAVGEQTGQTATPQTGQQEQGAASQEGTSQGTSVILQPGTSSSGASKPTAESTKQNADKTLVYIGKGNVYTAYAIDLENDLPVTEQAERLIDAIGDKTGYQIKVKDIYSGKGGMSVDLKADSAPFDLTDTYWGNGTEVHELSGAESVVCTLFDSMQMTLQQHFGTTMDVYFSKDGGNILIDFINPEFSVDYRYPYQGSQNHRRSSQTAQNKPSQSQSGTSNAVNTLVYVGMGTGYTTYETTVYDNLPVTDRIEMMINEIAYRLGYSIMVRSVSYSNDKVTVDLDADSAPFDVVNTYRGNGTESYRTAGAEETAYTIFDSIRETIQQYLGRDVDVYLRKNGGDIVLDVASPAITIKAADPYQGSILNSAINYRDAINAENSSRASESSNASNSSNAANDSKNKTYVYVGRDGKFTTYEATVYDTEPVTTQAEMLINEISYRVGYQIYVKEVYSGKGGMTISLSSDSAPFDVVNTYRGNGTEDYKTYDQEDTAYTIFDSIKETLQQYFGRSMDVYLAEEDGDIVIDSVSPAITIKADKPY